MGKLVIISAPSGTGKSTLINRLRAEHPDLRLRFSVSATSRPPRGEERDGVEYYFFSQADFEAKIKQGEFLEYEEVYSGRYYGTLRSEVERCFQAGDNVIFDVDYVGAQNIKRAYGSSALSIFIKPPSIEELRRRLLGRSTDSPEVIEERVAKAAEVLLHADRFDRVLINDDLEDCYQKLYQLVSSFLACS